MKEKGNQSLSSLIVYACFLGLSLSCSSLAAGDDLGGVAKPRIISDVNTMTVANASIEVAEVTVNYSVSYQSVNSNLSINAWLSDSPREMDSYIYNSSNNIIRFIASKNIPVEDCKGKAYNINIFSLDRVTMMQRDRFTSLISSANLPQEIWGFYDPTFETKNNSAILISNINHDRNLISLHHEMAHYWWDRLCIDRHWSGNTESFAVAYENYFRRGM